MQGRCNDEVQQMDIGEVKIDRIDTIDFVGRFRLRFANVIPLRTADRPANVAHMTVPAYLAGELYLFVTL